MRLIGALIILILISLSGCFSSSTPPEVAPDTPVVTPAIGPKIDADYAYDLILKYEKFGPKIPGSVAHKKAGDWMMQELKSLGLNVQEQTSQVETWDKKKIPVRNIIAQLNPSATTRYLLSAHWDNRPWADEGVQKNRKKPVPGVNDGGSGVAVLMAIAKAAQSAQPTFGLDFIFWDAEDWGNPHLGEETYCLGTQLWAKNTIPANYHPRFGINYDMVGRIGSLFPSEDYSLTKAALVLKALRDAALSLGYQDYFPSYRAGRIIDDHYFVTEGTGIPMVDLIAIDPNGRFPPEWHTVDDTSKYISRDVMKAVAQTTIQLLWTQK